MPPFLHTAHRICSRLPSRPGPVYGIGDGVIQTLSSGKYLKLSEHPLSLPDVTSTSSAAAFSGVSTTSPDRSPEHSRSSNNNPARKHRASKSAGLAPRQAPFTDVSGSIIAPACAEHNADPGRTNHHTTEAPRPSVTVAPSLCRYTSRSCRPSRSGPVYGSGRGVFQASTSGEYYVFDHSHAPPDTRSASSDVSTARSRGDASSFSYNSNHSSFFRHQTNVVESFLQPANTADPGRMSQRFMGGPRTSGTVAPPPSCDSSRSGHPSRPGPVYGHVCRVSQQHHSGEYPLAPRSPLSLHDTLRTFSTQNPTPSMLGYPSRGQPASTTSISTIQLAPPVSSANRSLQGPLLSQQCHLYYQNVNSMYGNLNDYLHAASDECYDFLALTESWLKEPLVPANIFGAGYEVFRCDRGPDNSKKADGGGVLIAVRRRFHARRINKPVWKKVEQVWVSVKLSDRILYLCVVYFPPDRIRDKDLYEAHLDSVATIMKRARPVDDIVIIGDFNLPKLTWRHSRNGFLFPDPVRSQFHPCSRNLLDCYDTATLHQINDVRNEDNRCLDLCFVSAHDTAPPLTAAPAPLVKVVARHPALVLSIDGSHGTAYRNTSRQTRYNFRKSDYDGLSAALNRIDWINVLDHTDIDSAVDTFTSIMRNLIDQFVPKTRESSSRHLPWQSPELLRLKTRKRTAFKHFSKTRTLPLRDHYFRLNHEYKKLSRRCFSHYQRKMQRELNTNPKKFWKFVDEQRKETGLPTSMSLAGDEADDAKGICQLFARKFSSVFSNDSISEEQVLLAANNAPSTEQCLSSLDISGNDVQAATIKLKHSCNPGPDGIPSTLLKRCSHSLLSPLLHLFRLSLATGKFPAAWKRAYMFPVHKKGDRTNVENYRGIAALCATSKLFELVVLEPVFSHCRHALADEQHGFLPKRSTATNLLCFTEYIFESFVGRSQTDAIYTDLSAAFDKLNHRIAVAKLEKFGLNGRLLQWFHSYLTGRSLRVKIEDALSDSFEAFSGVAQGSHIGPLVFLFYFNDVNYSLLLPRLAFADDLKLYSRITCTSDAEALQRDLVNFALWCKANQMDLNPGKCQVVTFSRKNSPIIFDYRLDGTEVQRTDHVKDLGVMLDTQLTFKQHISFITAKASRQLGLLIRMTRHFTSVQCLKTLYCSLVRSSLEYCSIVWYPHYNNAAYRLESIQRRFVRYALRLMPWRQPLELPPYENRCRLLQLDTLQLRRDLARALTVSDILNSHIDCPALLNLINLRAPARRLRRTTTLQIPLRRTNYSSNGAIIGLQRAFNKVSSAFDFHLSRVVLRSKFLSMLRSLFTR